MASLDDMLISGLEAAFPAGGLPRDASPTDDLPERIGAYEILGELGRGGMGLVYEARHAETGRRVALKVSRAASLHPGLAHRFIRETELLGRLRHPAIASLLGSGNCRVPQLGDVAYFVMALVDGAEPITRYVVDRGLDPTQRVALFLAAVAGVAHGHDRNVVHRDLKPGNLLVDDQGRVHVIDFGLARTANNRDVEPRHTRAGELLGTPEYMSPEQWVDARSTDARGDVYALGVLLFELLTGRLPYDLAGKSVFEIGEAVRNTAPHPLPATYGDALGKIVARCLEKVPRRRYRNATVLLAALRSYLAALDDAEPGALPDTTSKASGYSPSYRRLAPLPPPARRWRARGSPRGQLRTRSKHRCTPAWTSSGPIRRPLRSRRELHRNTQWTPSRRRINFAVVPGRDPPWSWPAADTNQPQA